MADKMQVKLLKKLNKNNVGDVMEFRVYEARALIAMKAAEAYVEKPARTVVTRVMEPPVKAPEPSGKIEQPTTPISATGTATKPATNVVSPTAAPEDSKYDRRDMQPKE